MEREGETEREGEGERRREKYSRKPNTKRLVLEIFFLAFVVFFHRFLYFIYLSQQFNNSMAQCMRMRMGIVIHLIFQKFTEQLPDTRLLELLTWLLCSYSLEIYHFIDFNFSLGIQKTAFSTTGTRFFIWPNRKSRIFTFMFYLK